MSDAPNAPLLGAGGIVAQRHGLGCQSVGEAPKQRSSGEIARDRQNAVGERDFGEPPEGIDLGQSGEEMGSRPCPIYDEKGECRDEYAGHGSRSSPYLAAAQI